MKILKKLKAKKPNLIKDWKNSWKYQSTQVQIWGSVLGTLWYQYPEIQQMLPPEFIQKFQPVIGQFIIILRITQFTKEELEVPKKELNQEAINDLIEFLEDVQSQGKSK